MSRGNNRKSWLGALSGLGWPLIIGLALASAFYVLILQGPLQGVLTYRYFANHPVSYAATIMFCVGLAALALKLADAAGQFASLGRIGLDASDDGDVPVEQCPSMLDQLEQLPAAVRTSYFGKRLRDALEFVDRRGSASGVDEELKYLSDMDMARQQESFALVRIITWATPMLGFLGTVIGITQALGDLDAELLATDPKAAMQGLLAGLYVAFDTTALALSLSIVLMFLQFLADRFESHLLDVVDERSGDEILGRFAEEGTRNDPHLAAVQRMGSSVLKTTEEMVQGQTEHWKQTMDSAGAQWKDVIEESGRGLQAALTESLDASLVRFTERLASVERDTDERLRARWEQWQTVLSDNARLLHSQQTELVRQGEVMAQVLQATGEVINLEKALNDNLRALSGAKNFEDTVMSLSAAIHLLNTRLGEISAGAGPVALDKSGNQGRAA